MTKSKLELAAERLAVVLERLDLKVVFAESCTGGLVSASLAAIPGISQWLCGSTVTYRESAKVGWLGVSPAELEQHSAVSARVTRAMAAGVLNRTPEAELAVAVTGHLGPAAPHELDGALFIVGLARTGSLAEPALHQSALHADSRPDRQIEAATAVLNMTRLWAERLRSGTAANADADGG